jgi:imidazolonepropionase
MFDVLIRNASEVVTCSGELNGPAEATLAPLVGGVVGIVGERIAWLGLEKDLPSGSVTQATRVLDAKGGFVGPGFVDCHTHVVFAGERADEFEQRCQGKTYLEIAAAGGGIARTVRATREATEDELVQGALPRLRRLLEFGVTTAEVKSGYGLDLESELRMLRVIRRLGASQPISLHPTFLGLHALPVEHREHREAYLELCLEMILPRVAKEQLATSCDAFVEQSAFTHDEARRLAKKAHQLGLGLRLHVDQLTANQGAQLAAELGATTADHLEQVSPDGIAALAKAGVIAVLAPTSTIFARARPFAPGRALRDAGVLVAVCTNCNPGSSMSENVALALGLACVENGLTPAEAYLGFTRVAGLALRDASLGRLFVGGPADVVIFESPSYRQLPYRFAMNDVRLVIKAGAIAAGRE